mmetsp:Transcript_45639/g.93362  ORF Transcript_45639/g.93362 Transcript_45639/m.93362 type:complete len:209 (-) Transcript_45639:263-889(-)
MDEGVDLLVLLPKNCGMVGIRCNTLDPVCKHFAQGTCVRIRRGFTLCEDRCVGKNWGCDSRSTKIFEFFDTGSSVPFVLGETCGVIVNIRKGRENANEGTPINVIGNRLAHPTHSMRVVPNFLCELHHFILQIRNLGSFLAIPYGDSTILVVLRTLRAEHLCVSMIGSFKRLHKGKPTCSKLRLSVCQALLRDRKVSDSIPDKTGKWS